MCSTMITNTKVSVALILFAILTIGGNFCRAEENKKTASEMLEFSYSEMVKGDLHRDSGNIKQALQSYKAAISGFIGVSQKNPELDSEVVRFRIAYCDNQIESLIQNDPSNGAARDNTGDESASSPTKPVQPPGDERNARTKRFRDIRKQIVSRQLTEARDALIDMIKKNPDDPEVRILMGIVQCMLGRFDDADNLMTTLLEERPEIDHAYVILSTAKMGKGDKESARRALEKAIALKTRIPEAYYNLTRIILDSKPLDVDAARMNYRKSLELGGQKDSELEYLLK